MTAEQIIYNTAIDRGIPSTLANLMVAQARHETGDFKSKFFTDYNNAFGYSYVAGGKWQLPGGGTKADNGLPIARYAKLSDSVNEIVDWIDRRVREGKFPKDLSAIKTPEQYGELLKKAGYFGDTLTNYVRGLKNFFVDNPVKATGAGLLLIAAIFFILKYLRK